jgi:hypothetical protein
VVEFEVGFESAGEPVVSSDLLVAVEDPQVVGVQQDPALPADQPDRAASPAGSQRTARRCSRGMLPFP